MKTTTRSEVLTNRCAFMELQHAEAHLSCSGHLMNPHRLYELDTAYFNIPQRLTGKSWRSPSCFKDPACVRTWSGTEVLLEHTESTQGGDRIGWGTSWRHRLPAPPLFASLPLARLVRTRRIKQLEFTGLHNKHPETGTGHSQEVTRRFRPCCSDTCCSVGVYAGDIFAPTPV